MRLNKYYLKLPLVPIALCLLGGVFNAANMTDSRHDARQSILALSAHNKAPRLLDDKTKPLTQFYKDLVADVAGWKIPRGYRLEKAYFKSDAGVFDLLAEPQEGGNPVTLTRDTKLVLNLRNETSMIACDSTTQIYLNDTKIWEVANFVHVRIQDKKYFYIAVTLAVAFAGLLLAIKRSRGVLVALLALALYLGLAIARYFVDEEWYHVRMYVDAASSVCVVITLLAFYFVQCSELAKYLEMHNMFAYQFKTYGATVISVTFAVLNHKLVVNVVNWFLWVPILQCYVFQNYEEIIDREEKRRIAKENELAQAANEFEALKIDDSETLPEETDFQKRRKKNFRPYLMVIHLALFLSSLIVCFKNKAYFRATREVDEAMAMPFEVEGMKTWDIEEFERNKENSSVTFKVEKTASIEDISLITSVRLLDAWIKNVVKNVSFKRSLIMFKDLNSNTDYKMFNEKNSEGLSELNVKLMFVFEVAEDVMTVAEIKIGENKVSTTLKNLDVLTFGLRQSKYLGIVIFFDCLVLVAALFFTGGKDKSKLRATIIATLIIVMLTFCATFFFAVPVLAKGINDNINAMEGNDDETLGRLLKAVIAFTWMRRGVTAIVFVCIVLTIVYLAFSLPKVYSSYNKNMTSVKKPITCDWKNMRVLFYQFLILIVSSTIIGHEAFGYKYDEFRNELLSLRYNLIMMFNKFLLEPKADVRDPVYLYHRVAIFVFYNVVLTGFIATFYFHSLARTGDRVDKNKFLVLPSPGDFNFDVNIKASYEEILAFKVRPIHSQVFLKSLNAYREYLRENNMEDHLTQFTETFSQSRHGLNKLTFNGDQYVYFERIKRYLLCIVFLRIKINMCNDRIKGLEEQRDRICKENDNKRDYLILLQKKLRETVAEIERFRAKNAILDLISGSDESPRVEKPATATISVKKYDTRELEAFITNPNPRKPEIGPEETPEPDSEREVEDAGDSQQPEVVKLPSRKIEPQAPVQTPEEPQEEKPVDDHPPSAENGGPEERDGAADAVPEHKECSRDKPDESENKTQKKREDEPKRTDKPMKIGIFKSKVLRGP